MDEDHQERDKDKTSSPAVDSPFSFKQDTPDSTQPATPAKAAAYLEDLACKLLLAHNTLNHPASVEFCRNHMSPEFVMHNSSVHDNPLPRAVGFEAHITSYLAHQEAHPDFEIATDNATASVDKDCLHAVVWVTEKGVNSERDIGYNRESVSRMHFKRRPEDGAWVWYKHMGVRGGGDYFS